MTTQRPDRLASDVHLGIGGFGHEQLFAREGLDRKDVIGLLEGLASVRRTRVDHDPRTRVEFEEDGSASFRPGAGKRTLTIVKDNVPELLSFVHFPTTTAEQLAPTTRGLVATELLRALETYEVRDEGGAITEWVQKPIKAERLKPLSAISWMEKGAGQDGGQWIRAEAVKPGVAHLEFQSFKALELGYVETGKVDDLVYAGADIILSPPGLAFPEIDTYALQRVCGNGSVDLTAHHSYRYRGNEGDDVFHWFRDSVRDAITNLKGMTEVWNKLRQDVISNEDRPGVIEALIREVGLAPHGPEADAIRASAMKNPPQNGFDVLTLATRATSHFTLDPQVRYRAQRRISKMAADATIHAMICPACGNHRSRRRRAVHDQDVTVSAVPAVVN